MKITTIIFATSNPNKIAEIRATGLPYIRVSGLTDIGFTGELPETHDTIEENSLEKAEFISKLYNVACFAEDTGLVIDALAGEPGVYSARYAGEKATPEANMAKVLEKMQEKENRSARFKTVITYYSSGSYVQFEGVTEGLILLSPRGSFGFGYDPIFQPQGSLKTYAEMTMEEKNRFSHRKKSFERFANHLKEIAV